MDKALLLNKAPIAAAIALTVGMLASFGLQGYNLWQRSQESVVPVDSGASNQAMQTVQREPSELVNGHLFGQPPSAAPTQASQTENLPTTNLKLTLRGVSASPTEDRASALVEGPDQQTQVYLVGDKLPGDATLRAVYPNRVVLDRRGRLENLHFPENEGDNSSASFSQYGGQSMAGSAEPEYPEYNQEYVPEETYQPEQPAVEQAVEMSQPQYEEPAVYDNAPVEVQENTTPSSEPAYAVDTLSEERKQEIRERLQRLREQIINQ